MGHECSLAVVSDEKITKTESEVLFTRGQRKQMTKTGPEVWFNCYRRNVND